MNRANQEESIQFREYGFRPGLLRGGRPAVQGDRGEPGRVRQGRPAAPRCSSARQAVDASAAAGCWRTCRPRTSARRGVVRRGQRRGALGDRRGPGRAAGHRAGAADRAAVAAARDRRRRGDPQGRQAVVRSGSARPATRCRPGWSGASVAVAGRRAARADHSTPHRGDLAEHALVGPGRGLDPRRALRRAQARARARAIRPKTAAEKAVLRARPGRGGVHRRRRRGGAHPARAGAGRAEHARRRARRPRRCVAALERAVAFGRWRAADVRSILAAGAGTPAAPPGRGRPGASTCPRRGRSLADYAPTGAAP